MADINSPFSLLISPDAPLELPSFQLTPSQRQVVFQGDSLPFQCQASFIAEDMQVLWYQDGRMVKPDAAQGIFIEKRMVQNCSLIARYGRKHSCSYFEEVGVFPVEQFPRLLLPVSHQCLDHLQHSAWFHWEVGVSGQDQQGQHHQDRPHCGAGDFGQILCS